MITLQILIFFVVFWGVLTNNTCKTKRAKYSLFLIGAFIPIWYVHSMVDPSSLKDLSVYQEVFVSTIRMPWDAIPNHWAHEAGGVNIELGYLYFNKIIGLFTSNFTLFLWIFSFIMLYAYFKSIKKYSPYPIMSVLILLLVPYGQSLFVIRQHMAMALAFLSIEFIIERKLMVFLFIMAITFFSAHHSCIVFFPLYFLYGLNGKKLLMVMITSMGLITVFWSVFTFISIYLDYAWYAQNSDENSTSNLSTFIQSLLYFILYIYSLKKEIFTEGINKLCFCILALAVFLNWLSIGTNFGRLIMYYNIFVILSVPLSLKYLRKKQHRYLIGFSIIILLLVALMYGSAGEDYKTLKLLPLF